MGATQCACLSVGQLSLGKGAASQKPSDEGLCPACPGCRTQRESLCTVAGCNTSA